MVTRGEIRLTVQLAEALMVVVVVVVQVVPVMDAVHIAVGGVLVLLHADGVRFLPWASEEPIPSRRRWTGRLPRRHLRPIPPRLPGSPHVPHGTQPHGHCLAVISFLFILLMHLD